MIGPNPGFSISIGQPAVYQILVQGRIGQGWEDWFEGMCLTRVILETLQDDTGKAALEENTLLTGRLPDQAALLGMLQRLYSFGLPILSVELIRIDDNL